MRSCSDVYDETGWARSREVSVADIRPPNATPVNRAKLADRIISGQLTRDEAGGLWGEMADGPTVEKLKHRGLFDDCARTSIDVTMAIVSDGDDALRAALAALARGETADAANRFELLIAQATDRKSELLRFKAALYAFIEPSVATNAITRAAALDPDDTSLQWTLGLLLEALGELGGAEASMQTVLAIETKAGEDNRRGANARGTGPRRSGRPTVGSCRRPTSPGARTVRKTDDARSAARMLRLLAQYDVERGEQASGRNRETGTRPRLLRENSRPAKAWPLRSTGLRTSARDRKDVKTAAARFERVREIGSAIGRPDFEAQGFEGIGYVSVDRDDLAGAEAAFRRAGELYASAGQEADHARMLSVLGSVLRDLESAKPRPPPPPSPHPPNTREYFWERIIGGYLTEDDATAMWQFITEAARPGRSEAEKEFDEVASIADFNEVVLEINEHADANERVVLAKLVEGQTSDAARRCDVIITQAGAARNDKLWYKGALLRNGRTRDRPGRFAAVGAADAERPLRTLRARPRARASRRRRRRRGYVPRCTDERRCQPPGSSPRAGSPRLPRTQTGQSR